MSDEPGWLFKVRRYGGPWESVMARGHRSEMEAKAAEWNTNYQTDTGWAEPWVAEKFDWPDLTEYRDWLDLEHGDNERDND